MNAVALSSNHMPLDTARAPQAPPHFPAVAGGDPYPRNRLVSLASRLLDVIVQIRLQTPIEPRALREQLMREMRAFQSHAQQAGLSPGTIVAARYCLCTALDEAVALTPWGRAHAWSSYGLLVAFHNETWGGEKFFQLLARLSAQPHLHVDLMELQYVCLALGFQGRYHVMRDGTVKLEGLRHRLYRLLSTTRPPVPEALSPQCRAPDSTATPRLRFGSPPWVWVASAALLAIVCLAGFRFAIGTRAVRTEAAIAALRLPEAATPVPDDIARWLATDLASGRLTVRSLADRTIIAIRGDGAFASGATAVEPTYLPTVGRIAMALNRFPGALTITGHTDNQPIHTPAIRSNTALSVARAGSVRAALLAAGLVGNRPIGVEGAGDSQPIDTNATPAGRARNRRVDIVLYVSRGAPVSSPSRPS
ncbi:MAG TPA: type IVB secretion system protein IcmH/DotU [Paraburkholderia sp.]|nr:type IVB secretion system protein IcmH/DotU [Paraburkholderia sp.]